LFEEGAGNDGGGHEQQAEGEHLVEFEPCQNM
jgi:hypothetical protein